MTVIIDGVGCPKISIDFVDFYVIARSIRLKITATMIQFSFEVFNISFLACWNRKLTDNCQQLNN